MNPPINPIVQKTIDAIRLHPDRVRFIIPGEGYYNYWQIKLQDVEIRISVNYEGKLLDLYEPYTVKLSAKEKKMLEESLAHSVANVIESNSLSMALGNTDV